MYDDDPTFPKHSTPNARSRPRTVRGLLAALAVPVAVFALAVGLTYPVLAAAGVAGAAVGAFAGVELTRRLDAGRTDATGAREGEPATA